MKDRLIVALDVDSLKKAGDLVDRLYPLVKIFKVGSQLFTAAGPEAIKMIHRRRAKVFLDLKFHDIPNTVAAAVKKASRQGVFMLNVHASGGKKMMQQAASIKGRRGPLLLAVTVLTSLNARALKDIGIRKPPLVQARKLALLARTAGLDGVICSAKEIDSIRRACGRKFIIVTPGIRPADTKVQDQKRIATPEFAMRHGADYIVVGRPIIEAKNPTLSAQKILASL